MLANGALDLEFNPTALPNERVWDVKYLPNHSILVAGNFTQVGNNQKSYIVKYNYYGELDATFNAGSIADSSGFNNNIRTILPLNNGKILVGGAFTKYGQTTVNNLALLNEDGSLDTTFNLGSGFNGAITKLTLLPDNNIAVVGSFTSFKDSTFNRFVVINSNGNIAEDYLFGLGADNFVETAFVDSEGHLLLTGRFNTFNGEDYGKVVRLLTFDSCPTDSPILGQDTVICGSVSFGEISVYGSDVKWYQNFEDSEPLPLDELVEPNTTYFLSQTINGCESDKVQVQFASNELNIELSIGEGVITSNLEGEGYLLEWIDCTSGSVIPTFGAESLEPDGDGSYKLRALKDGCVFESDCVNFLTTGISITENDYFKVFPNPCNNKLTISFSHPQPNVPLELLDISGKAVISKFISSKVIDLDVSHLSKGIYILRIGELNEKIIKQ